VGKYVTYPKLNSDFVSNFGITNPLKYTFYGVCVSSCPSAGSVTCNYDPDVPMKPWNAALTSTLAMSSVTLADKVACLNGGIPTGIVASNCSYVTDNCWYNPLDTSSIYYRCIPRYNITATSVSTCAYPTYVTSSTDPRCILAKTDQSGTQYQPAKPNKLFNMLNTGINAYGRYFGDLEKTWWVILVCSVGIACATGFVFVQLVKTFVGCMVWTIITLTLLLMATLTGYFYWQAGLVNPTLAATVTTTLTTIPGATNAYSSMSTAASSSSATWGEDTTDSSSLTGYWSTGPSSPYAIMAYVSTFCCVVALCIVISVGSAIRKAIEVIQLGADALKATPSTLLMPLLSTSALCFFWSGGCLWPQRSPLPVHPPLQTRPPSSPRAQPLFPPTWGTPRTEALPTRLRVPP